MNPILVYPTQTIFHWFVLGLALGLPGFTLGLPGFLDTTMLVISKGVCVVVKYRLKFNYLKLPGGLQDDIND